MKNSLLPADVHHSWSDFLTCERIRMINDIAEKIGEDVNPDFENILRFLRVNLDKVKIVILGQDPYPEKGTATGRAFEVGGLKSWDQPFRQVSLKNIIRLIYKSYNGITEYECIPPFNEIKKEIKKGKFRILPPHRLFESWEEQGVLLLNTSFSCIPNCPESHAPLWKDFTCQLIDYISEKHELYWFLWGKRALSLKPVINRGIFFLSRHPMLCSRKYEDDFLKSCCFAETMHIVNWLGI
ncbi:uracil-DNA glycosylase [Thermoclostridium stercorarium subsp. thermolacticum DSM 2910]|uniref:uracil-DNA glycosylase n=1 Tax=Thermoclostridium stercorarium subsp. thermolacticum DSM 2910 TaxID=1121336 RepID=A0A1B1YEW7_THEST|nr:uracil-DNA glycosylase [Thermoclostridium stercorarium]ANW99308.1 uracil-DNA glycosylase [Thermoclostridium stercorarium subsp. thermolacticum DSM 2910]